MLKIILLDVIDRCQIQSFQKLLKNQKNGIK